MGGVVELDAHVAARLATQIQIDAAVIDLIFARGVNHDSGFIAFVLDRPADVGIVGNLFENLFWNVGEFLGPFAIRLPISFAGEGNDDGGELGFVSRLGFDDFFNGGKK